MGEAPSVATASLTSDFDGVTWAHHSPPLGGLSFRFDVRCDDEELGCHVESLLAALEAVGPTPHCYSLLTPSGGGVNLYLDEHMVASLDTPSAAIDWLLWDINRAVADASGEHILFHAGGVQAGEAGVILPAPSGSGKSTLVAGLVRDGLPYLSDELIAVSTTGGQLLPYPKPLALKSGSFSALKDLEPKWAARAARFAGEEWYVPIRDIEMGMVGDPSAPRFVIVPRFSAAGPTRLTSLSRTEAFLALATNSVNLDDHGASGAKLLGELVAGADCYQLEMSDLRHACALVMELVMEDGSSVDN
jgi:hypothetical protein